MELNRSSIAALCIRVLVAPTERLYPSLRAKARAILTDDRIRAHFLTCFLALLLYKFLEKKVNRGGNHFSTEEIIGTLSEINYLSLQGEGYIPTYTRTDLTSALHGSAGFRTDTQIVTKKRMRCVALIFAQ